jgi:hypothetical protein
MKIRRVTLEIEVPWNAEYESMMRSRPLDGKGLLRALNAGLNEMFDITCIPYQAQVVKEEVSKNTQIGVFTEWLSK